ncbi:Uncharacterized protein FKW44_007729 [Caligus rogercresseyi]|uniref:Uncharacterized protein n=1 Tax=Caligus rogercresseyi TaxID=217165 RepID=A0A7T8KFH3_CALRO|nr:Uncharacterized protein FKW44_007729 [Caligus rogercresseyi]
MKDKTVKMAEKGAVSAGGKLGEEEKKSNNTPLPSRLYPSPYLSHPTKEDPGAPEEKPPRKTKKSGKITALKHNNERVASWTKGLNVGLLNEPINDPDGWKEVLDSRVKPMTPHDDLDMDYSSSSSHIPRYSEPPKSMASNGYDKSSSSSASSIELIKSEPPAFPKHHQELDALTREKTTGGPLERTRE